MDRKLYAKKAFYDLLRLDQDITDDKKREKYFFSRARTPIVAYFVAIWAHNTTHVSVSATSPVLSQFYCSGLLNDFNHDLFEL